MKRLIYLEILILSAMICAITIDACSNLFDFYEAPETKPVAIAPVIEEPVVCQLIEAPKAPISDEVPLSWELQQVIVDSCEEYNLEVVLVLGVIDAESDFRETADNGIAYGLMQIHCGNQEWVRTNADVTDIYDSAQNIRAGCWILSKGIELHGDIEKALVWYNAGRVYADSTEYSREVLTEADKWMNTIEGAAQ